MRLKSLNPLWALGLLAVLALPTSAAENPQIEVEEIEAMGGEAPTFAGLAGLGDLLATCMSPQSRNRRVGEQLGRGRKIEEVIAEMNMVAEGVKSSPSVLDLARRYGVEMPITEQIYRIVDRAIRDTNKLVHL